jgi:SAM-dependent methyltransferase
MNLFKKIRRYYKAIKLVHFAHESLIDFPKIENLETCYAMFDSKALSLTDTSTLDLGCGDIPKNPFKANHVFGIDIRPNEDIGIRCADLTVEPIPFEDAKFDFITAYDFLEHVPRVIYNPQRRFPFVELMNEVYRTLKPGGIFLSHTPAYPFSPVFQDPTHVNILTDQTFPLYFDHEKNNAKMYGFNGSFSVKFQARKGIYLISVLQKL